MEKTSEKIKDLPKSPGVYHFLGEKGEVLYVGKAKNLKNRLRQYFLKELGRGPAIEQMVGLASDIKYIETDSEIEAVILEAELIKKLKPKYNIKLKDDKSFLAIKITKKVQSRKSKVESKGERSALGLDEQFPLVSLVRYRDIDLNDKTADYFGPYPSGELLKKSLRFLRKIFPFRDCSKTKFNAQHRIGRTCIFGDIRVCSGPCNEWVTPVQYKKNILYLKNFLRGKKKEIVLSLEKEMKDLSKNKKFEEAALVRNKIQALDHLKDVAIGLRDDVFATEKVLFKRIECYDISNIGTEYAVGSMVVFSEGKADKEEYRKFKVKSLKSKVDEELLNSDLSRLKQVLERRFKNDWPRPDLVIIDGGPLQLRVAREAISDQDIPIISISKGPKRDKNDFHFSDSKIAKYFVGDQNLMNVAMAARDEAHRFAISYYRTLHRHDLLKK